MNFSTIHIIRKSEIAIWLRSESFKNYEFIPLSQLRAESYINNPHANPDDPLVFMLMKVDQVIAFRTVLPDKWYSKDGQTIRFAWLSGSWVHPSYRRKGYSTHLLKAVEKHWQGRLMYTNNAAASKKLYDKTCNFVSVAKFSGIRFYTVGGLLGLIENKLPFLKNIAIVFGWGFRLLNKQNILCNIKNEKCILI